MPQSRQTYGLSIGSRRNLFAPQMGITRVGVGRAAKGRGKVRDESLCAWLHRQRPELRATQAAEGPGRKARLW